ncbi:MAG: acyl carrier protein [Emcibacteraceae bacterium]|nr:acyl carrier protein [Emcibacteraceae bacterium]
MNKAEFIEELKEIMERDEELTDTMLLEKIEEWDSLARITFMSFIDAELNVHISTEDIKKSVTVTDLINFVSSKLTD